MLSSTLQKFVLEKIHKETLDRIQILSECSSIEKSFIISHLKTQISMEGDQIVNQGESGDLLYFINKGEVEILLTLFSESKKITIDDQSIEED